MRAGVYSACCHPRCPRLPGTGEALRLGPGMATPLQQERGSARSRQSTQQTACLVADLDRRGRNGFVLGFRFTGPALSGIVPPKRAGIAWSSSPIS